MSEDKKSLINLIPDSVDSAVKNITDKPTQNIGTTIADIWYLVFGGISQAAEEKKLKYSYDLQEFENELKEKISKIPDNKLTEPDIQITAQALENSKYCIEKKELRKMFTSLISNSMNTDYDKDIHPSFAETIKQMSSLDANIIQGFKYSTVNGFPLCQYVLLEEDLAKTGNKYTNKYSVLLDNVYLKHSTDDLSECSISIASLIRFGLLYSSYETYFSDETMYNPFLEHIWFTNLQKLFFYKKVSIKKGIVALTPLGQSFIKVCIPD